MVNKDNLRIGDAEEAEIIEKIRVSYIKNRGNSLLITKELNYPKEFIYKTIRKFKKESKHEMPTLVAEKVLEHLMLGYMTRTQYLFETIKDAERAEKSLRSTCCKSIVRELDRVFEGIGATKGFECLLCKKEADVYVYLDTDFMTTKMNALEKLRKEDELLHKWLIENKYTEKPSSIVVQDNSINIQNNKQLSSEDVAELEKLGPLAQEELRLKIEKKILDVEITPNEDDPKAV